CPASTLPWFVDAQRDLMKMRLGPHFEAVLAAWTWIEDASQFEQGPTNLPSKFRPKQVTTWISNARGKRGETPAVADLRQYGVEWKTWWDLLQPEWREKAADGLWSVARGYGRGGCEWGPLYQWGVNGVLSVVASLYFWGCSVRETRSVEWE
ncbi:hypothetical protein B0H14DRAFT_2180955, partial [Mycena olivaceomarginata]